MVIDSLSPASLPSQPPVTASALVAVRASTSGVTVDTAQAVQESGPAYFSPRVTYDNAINLTILQLRDPETGEVRNQYPSEHVVQEYRRHQEGTARGQGQTRSASSGSTSSNEGAVTESQIAPAPQPATTENATGITVEA